MTVELTRTWRSRVSCRAIVLGALHPEIVHVVQYKRLSTAAPKAPEQRVDGMKPMKPP